MALIDEVKTALRVSIDDDDINAQIAILISSAKEDLIYTADVNASLMESEADLPALIKLAITTFVKAYWTDDDAEAEKLRVSYDQIKAKLSSASYYSTYSET